MTFIHKSRKIQVEICYLSFMGKAMMVSFKNYNFKVLENRESN